MSELPDVVPPKASALIRRQRAFLIVTSAAAVSAILALLASLVIKSPAQVAAEQSPPPPSTITATVQRKVLVNTLVVRANMVATDTLTVVPVTTQASQSRIVTGLNKSVGAKVSNGDVLGQVSGRPIIALLGSIPAYRTLKPGLSGSDVRQLQKALISMGYLSRNADTGYFGAATQGAVTRCYAARGFEPLHTWDEDPAQQTAIDAAKQAVLEAQRRLRDARAVPGTGSSTRVSDARVDLSRAQATLARILQTAGVEWPLGELVFVPTMPATVAAIKAARGVDLAKSTTGELMVLNLGRIAADAVVPQGSEGGLKPGLRAKLFDEVAQRGASGTIAWVRPFTARGPTDASGGQSGYPIRVNPDQQLPQSWAGQNVRVEIALGQTGAPVLVVPVSAVVTRADQKTVVTVLTAGERRPVVVVTGLVVGGEAEVTPDPSSGLAEGDLVVVG